MNAWSWLPVRRLPLWMFAVVTAALVAVDFLTGPYYQFPSVYVIFIVAVAWFNGLVPGLVMAVILPFTRVALMEWYWNQPWDPQAYVATAFTRLVSWVLLAITTARLADHERSLRTKVNTLVSLLPICADCHKIRGTNDRWQDLTTYAQEHQAQFAAALCPSCMRARLPEHVPPTV